MWSFHVVVLQRTATKCTKMYNVRAEPLYCYLKTYYLVTFALPLPLYRHCGFLELPNGRRDTAVIFADAYFKGKQNLSYLAAVLEYGFDILLK